MPRACACGRALRNRTGTSRGSHPPSSTANYRGSELGAGRLGLGAVALLQLPAPELPALDPCLYFNEIELSSHAAFAWFRTPFTFAERTRIGFFHFQGNAAAPARTCLFCVG